MTVVSLPNRDSCRPLLLDLFCGAGGAAVGYHEAGFDVVGVDVKRQPRYPFPFIQDDALAFLEWMLAGNSDRSFDAIHASPPCQAYSIVTTRYRNLGFEWPDMVAKTREALKKTSLPYVIENVPGAPMENPLKLCGTMFGLVSGEYELHRHRLFELGLFDCPPPSPCNHNGPVVGVYGGHVRDRRRTIGVYGEAVRDSQSGKSLGMAVGAEAMGVDWMRLYELCEAIPPAYTEYVGRHLLEAVNAKIAA